MIQKISLLNSMKVLNNQYFKLLIIHSNNSKKKIKTVNNLTISYHNINRIIFREDFSVSKNTLIEAKLDNLIAKSSLALFYNFESLFRSEFRFDLMTYLKQKSKNNEIIVVWPGDIRKNLLIYSRPDRSDYYTHKIDNYIIFQE